MRLSYATMHLLAISRQERGRILDVILTYYRLHQPDFPEMKSLPVLRTLGCELWTGGRLMVSRAGGVFDAEGALTDAAVKKMLGDYLAGFVAALGKR